MLLSSGGSPLAEGDEVWYGDGSAQVAQLFFDEEGWPSCSACGSYTADHHYDADSEANTTDTESEWEFDTVEEQEAYLGSFEGTTPQQLREE